MPLGKATVEQIQDLGRRYPSKQSAIIPALWAVQHEQGYVTEEAMGEIAEHLGLPASLIEATSSFYSMFLTRPEGRHGIVICVNAPCMLRGADEMAAYLAQALGVRDGQTTADGAITWHSTIECLGACGGAPMMQVDHRFEEDLTPERIDAIIDRLRHEPAHHVEPKKAAALAVIEKEKAGVTAPPKRKTPAPRRPRTQN
jgi:NADH-quinone oxidoreductase subunit E